MPLHGRDLLFYFFLQTRSPGRNVYHFQCLNIETDKTQTLHFRLAGFLEDTEVAFKAMKKPQTYSS